MIISFEKLESTIGWNNKHLFSQKLKISLQLFTQENPNVRYKNKL